MSSIAHLFAHVLHLCAKWNVMCPRLRDSPVSRVMRQRPWQQSPQGIGGTCQRPLWRMPAPLWPRSVAWQTFWAMRACAGDSPSAWQCGAALSWCGFRSPEELLHFCEQMFHLRCLQSSTGHIYSGRAKKSPAWKLHHKASQILLCH